MPRWNFSLNDRLLYPCSIKLRLSNNAAPDAWYLFCGSNTMYLTTNITVITYLIYLSSRTRCGRSYRSLKCTKHSSLAVVWFIYINMRSRYYVIPCVNFAPRTMALFCTRLIVAGGPLTCGCVYVPHDVSPIRNLKYGSSILGSAL